MECDCDGNLNALIISGEPSDYELTEAWGVIKSEYADAIGNGKYISFKKLFKEIGVMRVTLLQVEVLLNVLSSVYHEELANRLNKELKTNVKFNINDKSKYRDQLESCRTRSKSIKVNAQIKEVQYNAIVGEKEASQNIKIGREHYIDILITLSNFAKYQIPDTITVFEFCDRVHRMQKFLDQQKRTNGR